MGQWAFFWGGGHKVSSPKTHWRVTLWGLYVGSIATASPEYPSPILLSGWQLSATHGSSKYSLSVTSEWTADRWRDQNVAIFEVSLIPVPESEGRARGGVWKHEQLFPGTFQGQPPFRGHLPFPTGKHDVPPPLSCTSISHFSHHGNYVPPVLSLSSQWKWWCHVRERTVRWVIGQHCGNMSLFLMRWATQGKHLLERGEKCVAFVSPNVRLMRQMQSLWTSSVFRCGGERYRLSVRCHCVLWLGNILRVHSWASRAMS